MAKNQLEGDTVIHETEIEGSSSLPLIGDKAPSFEVTTTHGTIRLEDYKGSWLILFSHPADFTPVCTTEFIAFSSLQSYGLFTVTTLFVIRTKRQSKKPSLLHCQPYLLRVKISDNEKVNDLDGKEAAEHYRRFDK